MSEHIDRSGVVIVGAGLGGLRTAESLRKRGYHGSVTMVGGESHPPYDRPPLTKAVLQGSIDETEFAVDLGALDIDVRLGVRATKLDSAGQRITLDGGASLGYESLVLAPGAVPRRLPDAAGYAGVHVVRTIDDALALRVAANSSGRAVVVGGGFIGCEVAASLASVGVQVDLVEFLAAPLLRVLGDAGAKIVADLMSARGIQLHAGVGVAAILGDESVRGVRLDDGTILETDVLVLGLGVEPDVAWLAGSGIDIAGTITCSGTGRTSAEHIWALGDAAAWPRSPVGGPVRVEHWTNVVDQSSIVAEDIAHGHAADLAAVPYFWSDLFDLKIQALGLVDPSDETHVLSPGGRTVIAYSRGGSLVALVGFSAARHVMRLRQAVAEAAPIDQVINTLSGR